MIYVIGIGIDGKESLTGRADEIIGRAGLIAGGRRHLDEFRGSKATLVPIGGAGGSLTDIASRIGTHLKKSKTDAVVLATGDPLLFGIADFIIRKFGKNRVEVIPNVSVVQEAFSRIKENWNGLKILSVHGRNEGLIGLCREVAANGKIAVFTDSVTTPALVARALSDDNVEGLRVYVFEDLGTPKERITEGNLKEIARKKFSPLNLVILLKKGDAGSGPVAPERFGLPDSLFAHGAGMITKEEIRAIALSKLSLDRNSVVWDVGSGCGSVAVEAARLAPNGRVYAIEKNGKRLIDIRKNKKSFNVPNLDVLEGTAPACLTGKGLLKPDAVFVGGGGKGLKGILDYVSGELKPGGRLVVNAVTIETAHAAFEFFKTSGWERELALVNIARAKDLGDLSLLSSHNPVFIIKGIKP